MQFHKHLYPSNFVFAESLDGAKVKAGRRSLEFHHQEFEDGVHRVRLNCGELWGEHFSQAELKPPPAVNPAAPRLDTPRLEFDGKFGFRILDSDGTLLLSSPSGRSFGVCGQSSIFVFERDSSCQFYGMGEKQFGFERSNLRTKFWNTDVWADFHMDLIKNGSPDPFYVSIPYLIVKKGNRYVGLLLDNPMATFASTATATNIAGQMAVDTDSSASGFFWMGCEDGVPDLYIIVGPSLAELTRKMQSLVGRTPLPPAWALGYQQCRWGYESLEDMEYLDDNFRRFEIPCDGFWFDIEYMDGYRVFTWDREKFPEFERAFADLKRRGRRIVPILDPGVKAEAGYEVYEDGRKAGVFCLTPEGKEYIGLVWPGETVFPDFSTESGRSWWAAWVKKFAATGVSGAWLDMNDPSTGHVDSMQMLFDGGKKPHASFHNQYAMGMAAASRQGFLDAAPDTRPFLLCRSGCTGSGKHTAIWLGDNCSNWHHLRMSIPMSINLALSGVPFNGPDVGGFSGDTSKDLMVAWFKAAALTPFMRNHSCRGTVRQEPWMLDGDAMEIVRDYIRLRYRFRPYLYNLFILQEEHGEAIMRPLIYDFADSAELPLGRVGDQFMVGPSVMHAPIVEPGNSRQLVLPGCRWFSLLDSAWTSGGKAVRVENVPACQTPLFLRDGAIIPMAKGLEKGENAFRSAQVEFHIVLDGLGATTASCQYAFDDGESFAYRRGGRSVFTIEATVAGRSLAVKTELVQDGYGDCDAAMVLYGEFDKVTVNGQAAIPEPATVEMAGARLSLWRL